MPVLSPGLPSPSIGSQCNCEAASSTQQKQIAAAEAVNQHAEVIAKKLLQKQRQLL
jgi:hypothetical protein